ncbi:hypothetical protein ACVIWU_006586 [Bradyrhizobium sp. USDA 4509]
MDVTAASSEIGSTKCDRLRHQSHWQAVARIPRHYGCRQPLRCSPSLERGLCRSVDRCVSAWNKDLFGGIGIQSELRRNFGAAYSFSTYQSGLQQIDFAAAVHLTSDKLEASDLSGLSVRPGQRDCRSSRRFILQDAARDEATRLARSRWIHRVRPASALRQIIKWSSAIFRAARLVSVRQLRSPRP